MITFLRMMMNGGRNQAVRRGDIWLVRHDPVEGSEQGGLRPFLVIQHDTLNDYSSTTIGFSLTTRRKKVYRTHVLLPISESGLSRESVVMTDHVRTVSKARLVRKLGSVGRSVLRDVEKALLITFGIL